jgi:5'-nucleotidase
MRILLVNDDGFDQPGLLALQKALSMHDTLTVAPRHHHSGSGMSLNLYSELRVKRTGSRSYSVEGTPVDCVKLALGEFMRGDPPDLVVSGINPGANLANNTWYSGTVAAATEAAFWLVPAMAISQEYSSGPDFSTSSRVASMMVACGIHRFITPGTVLNVNVPSCHSGGFRLTATGSFSSEIPFVKHGEMVYRYGPYQVQPVREESGTDVHALMEGHVSITPLLTARNTGALHEGLSTWCSQLSL